MSGSASGAGAMKPPQPWERAEAIVGAVAPCVEVDLAPVRAAVVRRLDVPSEELVCERAERIAAEELDAQVSDELVRQCERALGEAHDSFLLTAARCLDAADDLRRHGPASWIALAVRHRLAFDAAWDAMAESGHVVEMEWGPHEERCGAGATTDAERPIERQDHGANT